MWHAFVRQKKSQRQARSSSQALWFSPSLFWSGQWFCMRNALYFHNFQSTFVWNCAKTQKALHALPAWVLLGVTISELNFNIFASALSSSFWVDQTNQSWRPSCCGRRRKSWRPSCSGRKHSRAWNLWGFEGELHLLSKTLQQQNLLTL